MFEIYVPKFKHMSKSFKFLVFFLASLIVYIVLNLKNSIFPFTTCCEFYALSMLCLIIAISCITST
jgi:hypothetical protein